MKRGWIISLLAGVAVLLGHATWLQAEQDEQQALRERFKQRHPMLMDLKRREWIGETHAALVEAVRPEYLSRPVDSDNQRSMSVRAFLQAENQDRQRLYDLLAKRLDTTPQRVAQRDAARRFRVAEDWELLKLANGDWVRKSELAKRDES